MQPRAPSKARCWAYEWGFESLPLRQHPVHCAHHDAGPSCGAAMDPSRESDHPAEHDGVIEEIDVHDVPTVHMAVSIWDRALVGLFAVAIAGGLTIAITNAIGEIPSGSGLAPNVDETVAPSSAAATTAPSSSGPPPDPTVIPTVRPISLWERTATHNRGTSGERYAYDCPSGGSLLPLWGTRVYTDDSSVCTAAVHRGLITLEDGGTVTIEIRRGRDSYRGTSRNGVISQAWLEPWPGSFVFVVT